MKKIYIEGKNALELRTAFSKLLHKELGKDRPKIVLGDSISETISKFRSFPLKDDETRYLLIDSDEPLTDKADLVRRVNEKCSQKNCIVTATVENTYFMVQEVEAWILSQPDALRQRSVVKGLPVCNIEDITKPSEKLSEIYSKNGKTYHKVKEFHKVFALLDTNKLKQDSSEFRALIETLR